VLQRGYQAFQADRRTSGPVIGQTGGRVHRLPLFTAKRRKHMSHNGHMNGHDKMHAVESGLGIAAMQGGYPQAVTTAIVC